MYLYIQIEGEKQDIVKNAHDQRFSAFVSEDKAFTVIHAQEVFRILDGVPVPAWKLPKGLDEYDPVLIVVG